MSNFLGLQTSEIVSLLSLEISKQFIAKQITTAIYKNGAASFESMTNLSLKMRQELSEQQHNIQYPIVRVYLNSILCWINDRKTYDRKMELESGCSH